MFPAVRSRADLLPAGVDFEVSDGTTHLVEQPGIAKLADGNFVVVWHDHSGTYYEPVFKLRGRRITREGAQLGTEFAIGQQTIADEFLYRVTASPEGEFLVVWTNVTGSFATSSTLMARLYDDDATPLGSEFLIDPDGYTAVQYSPDAAFVRDGDFVVVWDEYSHGDRLYGRRFDRDGVPTGTRFPLISAMGAYPTIASRADGSFVTAWAGPGQAADIRADVFARSWDASGNAAGATFRVNTYTPGFQLDPAVSAMDDGRFVVVWTVEPADYSTRTLKGQTFGADGAPAGVEFPVSASNLPYEEWADVAHGPGGGFVVTWSGAAGGYDGTYNDIRTRRFDGTGAPSGTEIMVNSYTSQNQLFSTIAADGDGSFLVVWQSDLQNAVIGRRIQIPSDELCGDPDESSTLDATDALIELRAAIELQTCLACICDVNRSGAVTAADALIGLQRGVDESKVLSCPVCS